MRRLNPSMNAPLVWGLLTLLTLFLFSFPTSAAKLRTEVGSRKVGVGQPFEVRVTAIQEDADPEPQHPKLRVKGKAELHGPSVGTQRRVSMKNFSFESETSVVATWTVTPTAVGRLVVGPGSFQIGSKTLHGEKITIEVVKNAQTSRRRSPFSQLGGRRSLFGDDPFDVFARRSRTIDDLPALPDKYMLSEAPTQPGFLAAHLEKKQGLLGEALRLVIVAYGAQGNFREVSPNEPSLADFLSYSVLESSHDEPAYRAEIQGRVFIARKLREYIIVPLKTGKLTIGGMTAVLQGRGRAYPPQGSPHGFKIQSPPIQITITNAPEAGKPLGFIPGDVGNFRLRANLSPRQLKAGDFAELVVSVSGRGQIPSEVLLPEGRSFTWDPPTMRGEPEIKNGELQGVRILKFPLQVKEAGEFDLGDVALPYFNPHTQRYHIARARLGTISVEAVSAKKIAHPHSPGEPKPNPQEKKKFENFDFEPRATAETQASPWAYSPPLFSWGLLFALPALVALGGATQKTAARVVKKRSSLRKNQAQELLAEAKRHLKDGDEARCVLLVEKGLYEALDHATELKNRGVLRSNLSAQLAQRGLDAGSAKTAQDLLLSCEAARYGDASHSVSELLRETSSLVATLLKSEKMRKKKKLGGTSR